MEFNKTLMIDDDSFLLELHQMLIDMAGLKEYFTTESEARSALEHLSYIHKNNQEAPKYILLDLNMPVMDGFEFINQFQERFANTSFSTKIIIVTSSTRYSDFKKAMDYPFVVDYKTKPLPEKFVENLIMGTDS
ncbi:response regulator [Plebeiibacterium sediminum]|uniref:Response regulator n=1 Tax=Plebeiibacterium sediminum TaxID=2992112 RepID=A0AAE3SDA3_9BACT|nr:response regulator [Plebeiobacterium sediminum]MCW3784890.1 response regulator [Plebeiobacterium sediminum]